MEDCCPNGRLVDTTRKEGCAAVDPGNEAVKKATCICPECTCTVIKKRCNKILECPACKKVFDVEEAIKEE